MTGSKAQAGTRATADGSAHQADTPDTTGKSASSRSPDTRRCGHKAASPLRQASASSGSPFGPFRVLVQMETGVVHGHVFL